MKKLVLAEMMLFVSMMGTAQASDPITPVVLAAAFVAGTHTTDEQHWSYRDGCKARFEKAANGSYGYDSYSHCQYLPRVYGGKEFTDTVKVRETLPTN